MAPPGMTIQWDLEGSISIGTADRESYLMPIQSGAVRSARVSTGWFGFMEAEPPVG